MNNTTLEQHSQNMPANGAYASINSLEMYFETHGTGDPLIVLHGGLGSTGMLDDQLPQLSIGRQVIALDLQAHGRTADIDRHIVTQHLSTHHGECLALRRVDLARHDG